jgi:hypothetical protein
MTALGSTRMLKIRSVLLVLAWSVSGIWSVGHVLTHLEDHESDHHVEVAAESPVLGLVASHRHTHSHPQPLPAASIGKTPELDSAFLASESSEITGPNASLRAHVYATLARATPRMAAARQPRAPPPS